tara:strand:+ start:233 stop:658 length:426 start_codon:yes stop_codon:yes gene_type:complete
MKQERFKISSHTTIDINILPLIDVLFAVLLFFILSSLILTKRYDVQINRPTLPNPSALMKRQEVVIISIDQQKNILLGSRKTNLLSLKSTLKDLDDREPITQLLIDADRNLDYGFIIKVLGVVSSFDFQSVGLTVDKESQL